MKNTTTNKKSRAPKDELRDEYDIDYSKSKPNRFAAKLERGAVTVILDPDVAAVFGTSKSVNTLLRSVISAVKTKSK